jgi:hypothetical protein
MVSIWVGSHQYRDNFIVGFHSIWILSLLFCIYLKEYLTLPSKPLYTGSTSSDKQGLSYARRMRRGSNHNIKSLNIAVLGKDGVGKSGKFKSIYLYRWRVYCCSIIWYLFFSILTAISLVLKPAKNVFIVMNWTHKKELSNRKQKIVLITHSNYYEYWNKLYDAVDELYTSIQDGNENKRDFLLSIHTAISVSGRSTNLCRLDVAISLDICIELYDYNKHLDSTAKREKNIFIMQF